MEKPHSPSCERNKEVILKSLRSIFSDSKRILEIGSGTGQHAVYFAERLPHLIWQTSDRSENHEAIKLWVEEAALENVEQPLALDVSENWPSFTETIDGIFSANAVHIMSWDNVCDFIKNAGRLLPDKGLFVLYGPFNYKGDFTSESNAKFDMWLKQRNPESGIRDFEEVDKKLGETGFVFKQDIEMPANNRILVWEKDIS